MGNLENPQGKPDSTIETFKEAKRRGIPQKRIREAAEVFGEEAAKKVIEKGGGNPEDPVVQPGIRAIGKKIGEQIMRKVSPQDKKKSKD
jgi:hypothetical protein